MVERKYMNLPKYPSSDTDPNILIDWGKKYDIDIHPSGIILPRVSRESVKRIVESYQELMVKVNRFTNEGNKILLLPGSYDLAHVGHLSFVLQAKEAFENKYPNSKYKTVMLVDDDILIREVKKEAYTKVIGRVGPIETSDKSASEHPRLISLSNFPVDLVGFAPSPNFISSDFEPIKLNKAIILDSLNRSSLKIRNPYAFQRVSQAIDQYESMLRSGIPKIDSLDWSIELWQLFLLSKLSSVDDKCNITRIVSREEDKYFDIVAALMDICRIETMPIDDVYCTSTKDIVIKYGTDQCLAIKANLQAIS